MRKRGFARGEPPPRGSIEYVAVGDMFDPPAPPSSSGFKLYEVSYGDLDAAERWIGTIDRSVRQARRAHGDQILSAQDARDWNDFMARWRPLAGDLGLPGHFNSMLESNKKLFDQHLADAKKLRDRFASRGMSLVPVPYMDELLALLREMPKKLTAAQMSSKLEAAAKCGDRMIDENSSWREWIARGRESRPLREAVASAREAAKIYARSRDSRATYSPGDPAYDEFLRRATKIWIEAAGLYGFREVEKSARAQLHDDIAPDKFGRAGLWLLGLAGAAYLGIGWLFRPRDASPRVEVPDVGLDPEDLDEQDEHEHGDHY